MNNAEAGLPPVRLFTPAEVKAIAAAVSQVSETEFRSRFVPDAMMRAEIYPRIWDRDPAVDDSLGYVTTYFLIMQQYLNQVAAAGQGLVVTIW